jgi:hypothetical protein
MASVGGCGFERPVATCSHAWLGFYSRSESIRALSVSAGLRDVGSEGYDVLIVTGIGVLIMASVGGCGF